jgi:predicted nucleic acid-binding protein
MGRLMRIYFDTCRLQRPLDDRSHPRIALEAEAILAMLALCEQGQADLVVSDMVLYESTNNPHPQKRQFIMEIIHNAKEHIALSPAIEQRATTFEQSGIKPVDAIHLALAEAAQVDYFCTCDDRFYRRAVQILDVTIHVRQPLTLAQEIAL